MKAVIYARVSTRIQEEAGSIETQLVRIAKDPIVAARFGAYEDMEQYLDNGVSGRRRPLWDRLAGKRLLADAKAGKLDVVIVYKFGRLGRKATDTEQAIEELLSYGVIIYDVMQQITFDNSSAAGKFLRQVLGIAAEFEVNNDAESMRDGMERLASQGKLMPTYIRLGYDWNHYDERGQKGKGAVMVVNEAEADLVRLIYSMFGSMSLNKLARWLNEQGYRLPCKSAALRGKYNREKRLFTPKAVMSILSDSLYTGMVEWGTTTTVPGLTPTPYSHHHPEWQIIPFEQFNLVQRIIQARRVVPSKSAGSPYIYSGLVRCPKCGGPTVGKRQWHPEYSHEETRRYGCRAYEQLGKVACTGWTAYEQTITKAIIPFLVDLLENRLHLRQYVEEEARKMMWEEHEGKAQRLRGQIQACQTQLKNVQKMTVEGLMTPEEAEPFIYGARESIEKAERQLTAIEKQLQVKDELLEAVSRVCIDVKGTLEGLQPMAMQAVARQVFKSLTLGKSGHGFSHRAWVETYEFRDELKDLLASSTLSIDTPALEIV
jgi:site-specific DNA recombinase